MQNVRRSALALVFAIVAATAVAADEIRVMTSGAFTAPYLQLGPIFERETQHKLITLATSMGVGTDFIPTRLQRGEPTDVVIIADDMIDALIRDGLVVPGSKVPLVRSAIGMAVRAGAPKPDISSVEAFRRALLDAKSIAYSASVSGDYLSQELFPKLGIADAIKAKSRRIERERVGAVVARGDAEIGFQQISELLPIAGLDYVGPLPDEVQRVTVFSAGIVAGSKSADAAAALLRFFSSPEAIEMIRRSGLDPITPSR